MDTFLTILVLLVVVALWLASVVFPNDSRRAGDWLARGDVGDRPPRIGD